MTAEPTAPPRKGRLSPARERELLQAAVDLVAELGYEQVTMAELAKRTKSSTATLYRQWESKPKMVITALKVQSDERHRDIDTGTLRGDLRAFAAHVFGEPSSSDPMTSIWYAAGTDRELLRVVREILVLPGLVHLQRILDRAIDRGEITDPSVAALVAHGLFGAVMINELLTGEKPRPELAETLIDKLVLPALTAS